MKKALMTALLAVAFILTLIITNSNEALASQTVTHTEDDYTIIPDKYNTGANEDYLTVVSADDAAALKAMYGSLPFKKSSDNNLTINFHGNRVVSGEIIIENIDFSNMNLSIYNSALCENPVKIIFLNCKFAGVGMNDSNDFVYYEFRNCTLENINGSNMDLYNCYIGGGQSDGIRAFNNTNVVNCFIADKSQVAGTTSVGNHTDGTQIYGTKGGYCQNIHYVNCRFELPQIKGATAYVNACLMLQIEFCDADNITFTDCKINGGGYAIYAWSKKDAYKLTNAVFQNISVGAAKEFGNVYPKIGSGVTLDNIHNTESLYIGSVWKEDNGVHLSVTNDTDRVRTLCVCTDYGTQFFTIDACPNRSQITSGVTYDDLPFDLDIEVGDAGWVVCYDVTDGTYKQIRYVNYNGQKVFSSENGAYAALEDDYVTSIERNTVETAENTYEDTYNVAAVATSNAFAEGKCGSNVTWTLSEDGTLVIEGFGGISDYQSGKKAPWTDYNNMITSIIIGEGITSIGNQAFRDMVNVEYVELPSTLITIGKIAFQKCTSLRNIVLPASLTSIGDRCFAADYFESVVYLGDAWEELTIGNYNESIINAMTER